jgi:uncharacterized membrane protein YgcG
MLLLASCASSGRVPASDEQGNRAIHPTLKNQSYASKHAQPSKYSSVQSTTLSAKSPCGRGSRALRNDPPNPGRARPPSPSPANPSPSNPSTGRAPGVRRSHKQFDTVLDVQVSGDLLVTETITQDLQEANRHGIERFIPETVLLNENSPFKYRKYPVSEVKVQTSSDTPGEFTLTRTGDDAHKVLRIRIGDPNQVIEGVHKYVITYRVGDVATRFAKADGGTPAHDELYWNGIGTSWRQPIDSGTVTVKFPVSIENTRCLTGSAGSKESCGVQRLGPNTAQFSVNNLQPAEGLTVVVAAALKSLTVNPVIAVEESGPALWLKKWGLGGLAFLAGTATLLPKQLRAGRDRAFTGLALSASQGEEGTSSDAPIKHGDKREGPVEFGPPEDARPAMLGTLEHLKGTRQHMVATIIDLASRGYLIIDEEGETWRLSLTERGANTVRTGQSLIKRQLASELQAIQDLVKNDTDNKKFRIIPKQSDAETQAKEAERAGAFPDLHEFEHHLLTDLFATGDSVLLSDLDDTFASKFTAFTSRVEKAITSAKWTTGDPNTVRGKALFRAMIPLAIGGVAFWTGIGHGIGLALCALSVVMGFAAIAAPARSSIGSAMLARTQGFRRFLTAGEHRLEHAERAKLFIDFLPYAVAFGITKQWSKRFADLTSMPETSWYRGPYGGPMSPVIFGDRISDFDRKASTNLTSTPSNSGGSSGFSGGGSSGGGGGGGGGGSW